MSTLRIIGGNHKGRIIPFSNKKFNDADITQQKVKGALFSKIGQTIADATFLDLYGGSGQIGFEALSRGARHVIISEKDRKRFDFIKNFGEIITEPSQLQVYNMTASAMIKYLSGTTLLADFIFLDPPYDKTRGVSSIYKSILKEIEASAVISPATTIIIQHFSDAIIDSIANIKKSETKKYGNTSLSFFNVEF